MSLRPLVTREGNSLVSKSAYPVLANTPWSSRASLDSMLLSFEQVWSEREICTTQRASTELEYPPTLDVVGSKLSVSSPGHSSITRAGASRLLAIRFSTLLPIIRRIKVKTQSTL